jgi:hypothetical protein
MIDPSRVLARLPMALRETQLKSYQEVMSNYLERRWEPSELVVSGALKGSFPPSASKPTNMLAACRSLENESADPSRTGDRSLRLLIPRVLPVLYEVRNNRGVGHVGGDVDANHMDAEAVQATVSWVMAELVRIFHGVSTHEAQQTVDALTERKTPAIWDVEGVKRVLELGMSAKNQVLLLLHHSTGWVAVPDLLKWVDYSNGSAFRSKVLAPLHKGRLIEFDAQQGRARISPRGVLEVEGEILKPMNA